MKVTVEREDEVCRYTTAENGANPMWCFGNTCVVCTGGPSAANRGTASRHSGERLYASALETIEGVKPYNNCRPPLFLRDDDGWRLLYREEKRTREPCPLAVFPDGRVFLSLNHTLTSLDEPKGSAESEFTEHSYRSFVADSRNSELLLFQNIKHSHAEYAFLDSDGGWSAAGRLVWPWEKRYDTPQLVRICYPNVQLKDRAVYFCGVSDVVEPYEEWRRYKREITGREWDFDFRRLFFTWSDDITSGEFHVWKEIASRDATCGWIYPADMYVDDESNVHLMWNERAVDERLREKFFPLEEQSYCLNYCRIKKGDELQRLCLHRAEGTEPRVVGARFHVTPDSRLYVLASLKEVADRGTDGPCKNYLFELGENGIPGP